MKGLILAAGRGSRMGDLTSNMPKCNIEIFGKRLLDYQINGLKASNIYDIAAVTGYLSEKVGNESIFKIYNSDWTSTQMVASMMCASSWIKDSDCIISYSDIFYDKSAVECLCQSKYDFSILYDPNWLPKWKARFNNPLDDAESFFIDSNSYIKDIGRKVHSISGINGQYMGIIRINANAWKKIRDFYVSLEKGDQYKINFTEFISSLIQNDVLNIHGIPYFEKWGEIDSASDLIAYNKLYPLGLGGD